MRQHGSVTDPATSPDDSTLAMDVLADLGREPMALYEVWYAANSLYPKAPMSARLAAAERVVRRLATAENVRLWRGRWIGPQHERESVSYDELADVLLSFSTWSPEDGEPVVWMELNSNSA